MHWNGDGQEERSDGERRVEARREWLNEKCLSGDVMSKETKRRETMTIAALYKAVRALVPYECTTHVEVGVWHYSHSTPSNNPRVVVAVYADYRGSRESVEAATAGDTLELFRIQVLPKLGLAEVAPAIERLAAMDVDELLLTE